MSDLFFNARAALITAAIVSASVAVPMLTIIAGS